MPGRTHSLRKPGVARGAMIAWVCAVLVLLGGSSQWLSGSAWSLCRIDDAAAQVTGSHDTPAPLAQVEIGSVADATEESDAVAEPTDDDETERCVFRFDAALPLDAPGGDRQAALPALPADRVLAPFHVRAFSVRGSPAV